MRSSERNLADRSTFPCVPGSFAFDERIPQGLSELGYIEGQNISVQYRFTDGDPESLRKLAAELADLKVEVILTINTPASQAAKTATKTIPIVFTYVADATEVVASLTRPGGNITGLTTLAAELSGKRLELIKETVPVFLRLRTYGVQPIQRQQAFSRRRSEQVRVSVFAFSR